jgi:hypothetical protein
VTVRLERAVSIRGFVRDERGSPVPGASVYGFATDSSRLLDEVLQPIQAGPDGAFELSGLAQIPYDLRASAEGFEDWASAEGAPVPAPTESLEIRMARAQPCTVRFRLRAPPGRNPPAVLHKSLSTYNWLDGDFVLRPSPGPGSTRLFPPGFAEIRLSWDLAPGETKDLGEITLDDGVARAGRVVDPQGRPIAGAEVWLVQQWSQGDPRALTAADGTFRLEHCNPEGDALVITADGFLELRREWPREEIETPRDLVLARGAVVRTRVVDASGQPVPGAYLDVLPTDMPPGWPSAAFRMTDHRGCREDRVPAGRCTVTVWNAVAPVEIEAVEGGTADVVLRTR